MKKLFYFIAAVVVMASCGKGEDKAKSLVVTDKVKARIDSALRTYVDSGYVAGVSALIFEKDKEVYFNAFGYADREAQTKMDRNTIVRIYSMTKPVTGVALMKLFDQEKFKLDDPLSKYAPEFGNVSVMSKVNESGIVTTEAPKRPILVRDITRHTAGFVNSDNVPGLGLFFKNAMSRENTLTQMAQKLATTPLMFHPGEQWAYGPSVDVQAYLVERLSGKPFDQYLQENIFDPLNMKHTRYVVPENERQHLAAMYRMGEDKILARETNDDAYSFNLQPWSMKPGGWGLTSTIDDYMQFAQMLVHKGSLGDTKILEPETVELMATNQLSDSVTQRMWLPSKGQVGFGIDFAVRLREPQTPEEKNGMVGEFFWDGAASTLFWVDPVNNLTAVLFVQKFPFDNKLHKAFRDAVYGKPSGSGKQ